MELQRKKKLVVVVKLLFGKDGMSFHNCEKKIICFLYKMLLLLLYIF